MADVTFFTVMANGQIELADVSELPSPFGCLSSYLAYVFGWRRRPGARPPVFDSVSAPSLPSILSPVQIPGVENAYCKYKLVHGDDWSVVDVSAG